MIDGKSSPGWISRIRFDDSRIVANGPFPEFNSQSVQFSVFPPQRHGDHAVRSVKTDQPHQVDFGTDELAIDGDDDVVFDDSFRMGRGTGYHGFDSGGRTLTET